MFDEECYADCFRRSRSARFKAERFMHPFCALCGRLASETHHMTYVNEGHELSNDLLNVCRDCHSIVEALKLSLRGSPRCDSYDICLFVGIMRNIWRLLLPDMPVASDKLTLRFFEQLQRGSEFFSVEAIRRANRFGLYRKLLRRMMSGCEEGILTSLYEEERQQRRLGSIN